MKILVIGDLHCGHLLGLTNPKNFKGGFELNPLMEDLWNWFFDSLPKDIDAVIWNGDLIDGEGRHETAFHLTTDVDVQIEMVEEIIDKVGAKRNIFTFGTPYHTGKYMDYERQIAKNFGGDIRAIQYCEFNGVKFNVAHTIGKTNTPVGGDIMRKKMQIWDVIESYMEGEENADYIVRNHIHEYGFVGNDLGIVITSPAMQIGSKDHNRYARRMSGGWYSVGYLSFDCSSKDNHDWDRMKFKYRLRENKYVKYTNI